MRGSPFIMIAAVYFWWDNKTTQKHIDQLASPTMLWASEKLFGHILRMAAVLCVIRYTCRVCRRLYFAKNHRCKYQIKISDNAKNYTLCCQLYIDNLKYNIAVVVAIHPPDILNCQRNLHSRHSWSLYLSFQSRYFVHYS